MSICYINYNKKDYYFESNDGWTSFSKCSSQGYNSANNDESGRKRYVKIQNFYVVTNNFWISYKKMSEIKDFSGMFDDTKNKAVVRRYCKSDGEYIVTDDFWYTFYFSKYSGGRVLDNSKILKTRITVIDRNTKIVETSNFYKDFNVISVINEENEQKRNEIIDKKFKEYRYMYDRPGQNVQKKCLCYQKYGYKIGKVLMLKLDDIHFNKKFINNDGYGSEFEFFAMQRINKNPKIDNNIVSGNYDGKVDAIFESKDPGKIDMFQIKFITHIEPEDIHIMKDNCSLAVDSLNYTNLGKTSKHLKKFMEEHKHFFDKDFNINIVANEVKDSEKIDDDNYRVFYKGDEIRYRFYDAATLVIQYVCDYLMGNLGDTQLSIPFNSKKIAKAEYCDDYFLFVDAEDLCKRISLSYSTREQIDELFINNVRGYLGANKKMQETIESEEEKSKFVIYNNGVSICCQHVDVNNSNKFLVLHNPYVVNGQQTILTLYSEFEDGVNLSNIEIPLFIKPYNNDEKQMLNVAIYNNTQNPVKDIDLLCGDINVRKIARKILFFDKEKFGLSFDSWIALKMFSTGSNSNIEITSLVIKKENIVAINDYFKVLLPILFHFKNKDGNIEMHLDSFNKNTTKYKDKYNDLVEQIEYFLNIESDIYFEVAKCVKKARDYVITCPDYLPAENLFGIAYFYGISSDEMCDKLKDLKYDDYDNAKDKISYLSKVDVCEKIQKYLIEKKEWKNNQLVDKSN